MIQKEQNLKELLLEEVISQIQIDIQNGDIESLEELLKFIENKRLVQYLPEENWEKYLDIYLK